MSTVENYNPIVEDPLIARLDLDRPVNADCLRAAIRYNEIHIQIRQKNIEALRKALARLVGVPAPLVELAEPIRHRGG
ncbi:MAG: hypothetical protein A2Y61_03935 [Chloroflexi bacterium RBG_13_60_13]|nr:MAG: hypothetical protein A2Y61_03935 [Chloroflexi bacterium RBG_13_60_13]